MMKKIAIITVVFLCISLLCDGQAPHAFKYQAVVRDTTGAVISNQLVSLRVSVLRGDINGEVSYSEIHDVKTNSLGLVNLEIGRGLVLLGDLAQISWGADNYFIQIEIDMEGAMNYQMLGTSQLLAVPYALYAEKSGSGSGIDTIVSQWKESAEGIYYDEGNVGINHSDPQYSLDMNGVMNVNGDGRISNTLKVGLHNFNVTSDGKVGIGTENPEVPLQIEGRSYNENGRNFLLLKNNSTDNFSNVYLQLKSGDGNSIGYLSQQSDTYSIFGGKYAGNTILWNYGNGLVLRTNPTGRISFETTDLDGRSFTELMRMTGDGKFGIGTLDPQRTLHINDVMRLEPRSTPPENPAEGDIYMDSSDHKLKVFDGTTWQSCW